MTTDAQKPSIAGVLTSGTGEVILIVEDNDALRRSVARQLRRLGYQTLEVANASDARLTLKQHKIDLLFTDIVMPGGETGIMLANDVMSLYPGLAILLTSGYAPDGVDDLRTADASLMTLYKPYRIDQLSFAVQQALHP